MLGLQINKIQVYVPLGTEIFRLLNTTKTWVLLKQSPVNDIEISSVGYQTYHCSKSSFIDGIDVVIIDPKNV